MKTVCAQLYASVFCGPLAVTSAFGAETLHLKMVVKVQEKQAEPPKPFADVGGFTIKRLSSEFKAGSCPNASNSRGDVVCTLTCDSQDADLRLVVFSPAKEKARIVAGYGTPTAIAVDIEGCRIINKMPLEIVYKTIDVMVSEFQASAPAVYNVLVGAPSGTLGGSAGVSTNPASPGSSDQRLFVKPLTETSTQLKALAQNPAHRDALLQLSKIATVYQESMETQQKKAPGNLAQYVIGAHSVVLQAIAADTLGSKANELVAISNDPAQLNRSVGLLEKELDNKPTLTSGEIKLYGVVRQMQQQNMQNMQNFARRLFGG